MDLFDYANEQRMETEAPLAARMRPRTLDEFIGQEHVVGEGRLLRRAIKADRLFSSLLFWGPPGVGKTTLAKLISGHTKAHFATLSAVLDGVPALREQIKLAKERRKLYNQRTLLFVDEVHRWSKSQQDALLPHVENGTFVLIGATTENPYFEVNGALVSRSRVFQLQQLTADHMTQVLQQALSDPDRGYGRRNIKIDDDAFAHLVNIADGDARNALNALELAVESTDPNTNGVVQITLDVAQESIQRRAVLYDKDGDAHYDTISAFIKSIRGSDPDAALYWLAKMLYAGETPRFIMRRLLILASEDIGLADPQALVVTSAAMQSLEFIGMPEGIFPLTEATLYLATAPKSNTTTHYFKAFERVSKMGQLDVPKHLQDSNRDGKALGHGQGYVYPHAQQDHWAPQQYLPDTLLGTYFYEPSDQGYEAAIEDRLAKWRAAQREALNIEREEHFEDYNEDSLVKIKRTFGNTLR